MQSQIHHSRKKQLTVLVLVQKWPLTKSWVEKIKNVNILKVKSLIRSWHYKEMLQTIDL